MNTQLLADTAKAMVADDKGLLAMDESHSTCNKRIAQLGNPQSEEARVTPHSEAGPFGAYSTLCP